MKNNGEEEPLTMTEVLALLSPLYGMTKALFDAEAKRLAPKEARSLRAQAELAARRFESAARRSRH